MIKERDSILLVLIFLRLRNLHKTMAHHPRSTWIQKNFTDNYSKDPYTASVLLESISTKNLGDFRYALEIMKCDPNLVDASTGISVFQTVLQSPNSSNFIKLAITNGANLYKV